MTTSKILEGDLLLNPNTMTVLANLRQAKSEIDALFEAVGSGVSVAPYEVTWAAFALLDPTVYAGITIRVTDRHQDSRGVGGILVTGGASWTLESPQVYYSTFADALSELGTLSNWIGWRICAADVAAGKLCLHNNGTRFLPANGSGTLLQEANGTLAAPTKSLGSGAAPQLFSLSSGYTIPANLIQAGDKLSIKFHARRRGVGAMTLVMALGTGGAVLTDGVIWTSALSATDLHISGGDIIVHVGATTTFMTSSTFTQVSSGLAGILVDRTTNVNFAAAQTLKFGLSTKVTSSDSLDLMGLSVFWMTA